MAQSGANHAERVVCGVAFTCSDAYLRVMCAGVEPRAKRVPIQQHYDSTGRLAG